MGITSDRNDPELTHGVDQEPTTQAKKYLVLSEAERAQGFVRPVRRSYQHLVCGTITSMNEAIAETYARQPDFYGATWCMRCQKHTAVGPDGEFVWVEDGEPTDIKVGT